MLRDSSGYPYEGPGVCPSILWTIFPTPTGVGFLGVPLASCMDKPAEVGVMR